MATLPPPARRLSTTLLKPLTAENLTSPGAHSITSHMNLSFIKACVLTVLLSAPAALFAADAKDAAGKPIALSGWNADVVYENGAAPKATSFDLLNQSQPDAPAYAWFESGLDGHSDGLPVSRRVISAADTNVVFVLQPYTNHNVLLLSGAKPSGTLVLSNPAPYKVLFILAAAGNGDANLTLRIHSAEGAESDPIALAVPDWFTGGETRLTRTPALAGLGRSNGTQGFGYEEHGDDGFALYQLKVDLAALGLDKKPIQNISFKKVAGPGTAGIFAISGE